MKIKWLPREPGHWKLVVEPLNVLLTLRKKEKGWQADCLGTQLEFETDSLPEAKTRALKWFDDTLVFLQTLTRELLEGK